MKPTAFLTAALVLLVQPAVARTLDAAEKKLVMDAVTKDFKDPASAQFKWLPATVPAGAGVSSMSYCGMVNGKNSYGAYTGYTPFDVFLAIKNGKVVIAAPISVGSPGNSDETITYKMCTDKGINPRQAS